MHSIGTESLREPLTYTSFAPLQNGHLTLPYKSTPSISSSALPQALKSYITEQFKTISPEAFSDDIARFCKLRKAAVEDGLETHRESAARLVK